MSAEKYATQKVLQNMILKKKVIKYYLSYINLILYLVTYRNLYTVYFKPFVIFQYEH